MKTALRLFVVLALTAMLSGCIIYASPDPSETVFMHPGEIQLFLVVAAKPPYPSDTTLFYEWYLDDEFTGEYDNSYFYMPKIGDIGEHEILCVVEVCKDETGQVIWTDSRKWDVEVEVW